MDHFAGLDVSEGQRPREDVAVLRECRAHGSTIDFDDGGTTILSMHAWDGLFDGVNELARWKGLA
jgi:hypothetical protein